jgi:enoyl-CoA hydratase
VTEADADIRIETRGALGLATLTRPQALNALNDGMVDALAAALDRWIADDAVRAIAVRSGGGRAFSAGGDIRLMHDLGRAGRQAESLAFWHREYRLNTRISTCPKPYLALIDGIVMGGGVGISLHGALRLAGPDYLFAMPEVGIGFFPDVGATYALPRLPGATGMYLALTGARIRRADAVWLGLATHAVPAGSEAAILDALAAGEAADAVAARFAEPAGPAPIAALKDRIDAYFSGGSLGEILERLEAAAGAEPFAAETLAGMRTRSPTSMAIAFEQMQRGGMLDFAEAMRTEFRIVSRVAHGHDFYEGVRALLIDKDNAPRWEPATVAALDPAVIAAHFAPLPVELDLAGTGV